MTISESLRLSNSFDVNFFRDSGSLFFARALGDFYYSDFVLILEGSDGSLHALASIGDGYYLSLRGFVSLQEVMDGEAASLLDFSYVNVHHVPFKAFVSFVVSQLGQPRAGFTKYKAVCREWLRNNIPSFQCPGSPEPFTIGLSGVSARRGYGSVKYLYLMRRLEASSLASFVHVMYNQDLSGLWYLGFSSVPSWYYRK